MEKSSSTAISSPLMGEDKGEGENAYASSKGTKVTLPCVPSHPREGSPLKAGSAYGGKGFLLFTRNLGAS
jgi:hypothetical protein